MGVEDFLRVALALPEVTLREHANVTTFKVRGKGFGFLHEADESLRLKATRSEQAALIAEDPDVFAPSWESGRFAWVEIRLDRVDPEELVELVTEAWRLSAPKKLAATLERGREGPAPG